MNTLSIVLAVAAVVGLGVFWPSLKVHYESKFASKFLIGVLAVATVSCVSLSAAFGWWVLAIYPIAFLSGSIFASWLTNGARLRSFILGGGIWLIGAFSVVAGFTSLLIHVISN